MAKKANRQEFIESTLGDIRYKDYKSPLDSFNEQFNDNNANDSATTAVGNSINNGSINNAACSPSIHNCVYNNAAPEAFPSYVNTNPIVSNGYLITKKLQYTFSAIRSAKEFLDKFYNDSNDISSNDIAINIVNIIIDQDAYFELYTNPTTQSTIIRIKVEPGSNNIHSLIIRIPPIVDINNMLAYASAIVTEDICGSVTDTPLKEEYAMRIFKAFVNIGIMESCSPVSKDASK